MQPIRLILPALAALALSPVASPSFAQSTGCGPADQATYSQLSATQAPPPLPVYQQPPIPGPGYLWTPGYWGYGSDGYYWIPGTWVEPPQPGLLWTPGYWGWFNGAYVFSAGYWGSHVGFYGGINYGYGYGGQGYEGGRWDHGTFNYNRSANNFGGVHITNVYNKTIVNNTTNHVSFNGGQGGVNARPTAAEQTNLREKRVAATPAQLNQFNTARNDPSLRASENHGHPPIAATVRAGDFKQGAVPAGDAAAHTGPGTEAHPPGAADHGPAEAHPGTTPGAEAHPGTTPEGRPPLPGADHHEPPLPAAHAPGAAEQHTAPALPFAHEAPGHEAAPAQVPHAAVPGAAPMPHEMAPHEAAPHEAAPREMAPHAEMPHEAAPHEMTPGAPARGPEPGFAHPAQPAPNVQRPAPAARPPEMHAAPAPAPHPEARPAAPQHEEKRQP